MTPLEHKGQFDRHPPWLRLICPACGCRLPLAHAGTWALCHCSPEPITAADLGAPPDPTPSAAQVDWGAGRITPGRGDE